MIMAGRILKVYNIIIRMESLLLDGRKLTEYSITLMVPAFLIQEQ